MMRPRLNILLCGVVLLSACSKRERSDDDAAEWADIQPLSLVAEKPTEQPSHRMVQSEGEDYSALVRRLDEMGTVVRAAGEMMITGERVILDYERRFVRMDKDVVVVDDRGRLETERLMGRFSEGNQVELIEAHKGVRITSEGRTATAETALYTVQSGAVELKGAAQLSEGINRLSGERLRFWLKGSRRMVCEPNARLEIARTTGFSGVEDSAIESSHLTEIRGDYLVYDEEKSLAEFDGNVRVRDPRGAMNCDKIRLHLKANREIDWIEALSEVIIQSDDRKALAERATYYADEGKFVLEGNPKVKQGLHIMTGDRITFWQENRRLVCEPNARILLYPDEQMRGRFLKDLND